MKDNPPTVDDLVALINKQAQTKGKNFLYLCACTAGKQDGGMAQKLAKPLSPLPIVAPTKVVNFDTGEIDAHRLYLANGDEILNFPLNKHEIVGPLTDDGVITLTNKDHVDQLLGLRPSLEGKLRFKKPGRGGFINLNAFMPFNRDQLNRFGARISTSSAFNPGAMIDLPGNAIGGMNAGSRIGGDIGEYFGEDFRMPGEILGGAYGLGLGIEYSYISNGIYSPFGSYSPAANTMRLIQGGRQVVVTGARGTASFASAAAVPLFIITCAAGGTYMITEHLEATGRIRPGTWRDIGSALSDDRSTIWQKIGIFLPWNWH